MKDKDPQFDEETFGLFASMAKEAHGYVYYESKVKRTQKDGTVTTHVEIHEKYRAPQSRAAKLLKEQGVEVKWIVDKKE